MNINIIKLSTLVNITIVFLVFISTPIFAAGEIPTKFKSSGKTAPNGSVSTDTATKTSISTQDATSAAALDAALKTMLPTKNQTPECPPALMSKCHFIPAAYQLNDPSSKSDYGNYDTANRPKGGYVSQPGVQLPINSIVIHDTEGSLDSTIKTFQDPSTYTSAHYVIDADGQIYQMVRTKDVAWHAGNWYANMHSIGIEHVGHAINGKTEYTPEMYKSSAMLVRYLALRFNFPVDHTHVIGHDNVQAPTQAFVADLHYDPGPFWNWQMLLSDNTEYNPKGGLVTITKPFITDPKIRVTSCDDTNTNCTTLPAQPTNFVYLRTEPKETAPLISDAALHPDGSAGTTNINDWSAKAVYGQQFVIADKKKEWTAIWYGGQKAWFFNPDQKRNGKPTNGRSITPRAGLKSIPVYGRAYPEVEAYAGKEIPVQTIVPLEYKIIEGQKYSTTKNFPTDYYYSMNIDASLPDDHTVVVGNKAYLQIQFNHRIAYVDRADVQISDR